MRVLSSIRFAALLLAVMLSASGCFGAGETNNAAKPTRVSGSVVAPGGTSPAGSSSAQAVVSVVTVPGASVSAYDYSSGKPIGGTAITDNQGRYTLQFTGDPAALIIVATKTTGTGTLRLSTLVADVRPNTDNTGGDIDEATSAAAEEWALEAGKGLRVEPDDFRLSVAKARTILDDAAKAGATLHWNAGGGLISADWGQGLEAGSDTGKALKGAIDLLLPGSHALRLPGRILFAAAGVDKAGSAIFQIPFGSGLVQLTHGMDASEPKASPDGTKIAFVSTQHEPSGGEVRMLSIMNADGSGTRKLVEGWDPAWSPDGSRLIFTAPTDANGGIGCIAVATGGTACASVAVGTAIASVAVDDPTDLTRLPAGGMACCTLTQLQQPDWSPDGSKYLFSTRGVHNMVTWGEFVTAADVTDGTITLALRNSNFVGNQPQWSPDGKRAAYLDYSHAHSGVLDIFVIDADGQDPVDLMPDNSESVTGFSWSPDGSLLTYDTADGKLYYMDAAGKSRTRIDLTLTGATLGRVSWAR